MHADLNIVSHYKMAENLNTAFYASNSNNKNSVKNKRFRFNTLSEYKEFNANNTVSSLPFIPGVVPTKHVNAPNSKTRTSRAATILPNGSIVRSNKNKLRSNRTRRIRKNTTNLLRNEAIERQYLPIKMQLLESTNKNKTRKLLETIRGNPDDFKHVVSLMTREQLTNLRNRIKSSS